MAAIPRTSANGSGLYLRCTDGGANDGLAVEATCDSAGNINLAGSLTLSPAVTLGSRVPTSNAVAAATPLPASTVTSSLTTLVSIPAGVTRCRAFVTYAPLHPGGIDSLRVDTWLGDGTRTYAAQDGSGNPYSAIGGASFSFPVPVDCGETKLAFKVTETTAIAGVGSYSVDLTFR